MGLIQSAIHTPGSFSACAKASLSSCKRKKQSISNMHKKQSHHRPTPHPFTTWTNSIKTGLLLISRTAVNCLIYLFNSARRFSAIHKFVDSFSQMVSNFFDGRAVWLAVVSGRWSKGVKGWVRRRKGLAWKWFKAFFCIIFKWWYKRSASSSFFFLYHFFLKPLVKNDKLLPRFMQLSKVWLVSWQSLFCGKCNGTHWFSSGRRVQVYMFGCIDIKFIVYRRIFAQRAASTGYTVHRQKTRVRVRVRTRRKGLDKGKG